MIKTEQDVYNELKKELGHAPRQDIWEWLVQDSYVGEVIEVKDIKAVVDGYKKFAERSLSQRKSKLQGKNVHTEPPDERLKYLSKILAWDAAQESAVIDFQREVLGGQLLSPDKIKDWIDSVASKEFALGLSAYLTIRLPPGVEVQATNYGLIPKPPIVIDKEGMIVGSGIETLEYAVPGDKWQYSTLVARGGILEKLRGLGKYLHTKYNWQEAQATTFVISGLIPLLPLAQSTLNLNRKSLYPAHDSVTIKLSPHLSPKEVANIYSKARRQLMSRKQKRNRPITKKHLELAVFYHAHRGMKWAEIKNLWNKEYPKYNYTDLGVTNFARDAKYAHDRLLGWVSKGGTV